MGTATDQTGGTGSNQYNRPTKTTILMGPLRPANLLAQAGHRPGSPVTTLNWLSWASSGYLPNEISFLVTPVGSTDRQPNPELALAVTREFINWAASTRTTWPSWQHAWNTWAARKPSRQIPINNCPHCQSAGLNGWSDSPTCARCHGTTQPDTVTVRARFASFPPSTLSGAV